MEKLEEDLDIYPKQKKDHDDQRPFFDSSRQQIESESGNKLFKMPYLRDIIVLCSSTRPEGISIF